MKLKHYLITRFNVPFKDYSKDKNGAVVRSLEWLEHRFLLFESFCLPSVKGQTKQNFTWLVFFDDATPIEYKRRIEVIQTSYHNFTPIYVNSSEEFMEKLHNYIHQFSNPIDTLITSRIDNDDAIHNDYIRTIQNSYAENTDTIYNFKWGLQLDLETGILYKSKDESNPFISRVCPYDQNCIKTVFEFGHHEAWQYLPVHQITTLKGWLVIVHNKNMLNTIGGKPLLRKKTALIKFNLPNKIHSYNLFSFIKATIRFYFMGLIIKSIQFFK